MEAGLARLARQPGIKRDEFLLCLYEKFHPACRDNFVVLTLF
jgi:hypothetical protein